MSSKLSKNIKSIYTMIILDNEGNEIGRIIGPKTKEQLLEELNSIEHLTMSKTYRHQDRYNYLHGNKEVPKDRLYKLLNWFRRINFWDWDLKILSRKHKDYVRGGISRIKGKNYR